MVAPQCAQLQLRHRRRVATLLIDNYDSYTYNIYQMLAQVNGVAPVVFRNDDFGGDWAEAWRAFQRQVRQQFSSSSKPDDSFSFSDDVELNVVISPGPGHPGIASDFGMCFDAIRCASVPLLGVCLGHQGLAQVYGGKVVSAPEVMHGRTSQVFFSDEAAAAATDKDAPPTLFSRIPNGFEVVRYHSLVADEASVPAELKITARTEDGVIMALQHATKQQFGVQFHPEAVCSSFGYQLFQNFRDITLQQAASQCLLQHSSLQPHVLERASIDEISREVIDDSAPEYKVQVRVAARGLASLDFAQSVFTELYADSRRSFWLDSSNYDASSRAQTQQQTSRFSLMGDSAGPLSHCVEYCILENLLRVYESDGETVLYEENSDILTHLRSKMASFQTHSVQFVDVNEDGEQESEHLGASEIPFAFRGGFVGYFGYEVLGSGVLDNSDASAFPIRKAMEKHLEDGDHVPDASFLFADRTLVFDHCDSKVYSVSVSRASESAASNHWHEAIGTRIQQLQNDFQTAATGNRCQSPDTNGQTEQYEMDQVVFHPSRSKNQYGRDIAEIQRLIHEGETYEVCLTNQLEASYSLKDPLGFYGVLRKHNPAPYAGLYLINPVGHFQTNNKGGRAQQQESSSQSHETPKTGMTDSYAICCSSPERFLRVGSDGWMESKPIKGTRRRGLNVAEDTDIAQELANCTKDRAENMMIADLVRNDFGVVAQIGSVHVPKLMAVETYATVHQLVTTVRGQRRADADVVDILNATFPGGSMTGAPKKRTMQIIRQLEQGPRGVYSGALGFLSLDGSCDLNIVIRTAVITRKRVTLGSGGAIIALSDTDEEYEEMLLKTRALVHAIGAFATGKHDGSGARVDAGNSSEETLKYMCASSSSRRNNKVVGYCAIRSNSRRWLRVVTMESELVLRSVWTDTFERPAPQSDAERALWSHLETLVAANTTRDSMASAFPGALRGIVKREVQEKLPYISGAWSYFEAANIVAKVDECICLPTFPAYADIQRLVTPPQRTPQANVWFRLESPEGVEYFYNRLLQSVTLVNPNDFDGANHPGVIQELIQEALQFDAATRLELEKRSRQRAREKLLAEDEWIECMDVMTTKRFYYSLKHYRIMWTPPENGAFITSAESVAYAAVLRLQAAYRRRRLEHKLHVKRTKRSSLPAFSALSKDKQSKFYS